MKHNRIFIIFLLISFYADNALSQVHPVKVHFISDGYHLNAEMYHSHAEKPVPTLILMHGYPGGEGDILGLGKSLSQSGLNVFVFNYQGTWNSEGKFSFTSSLSDVYHALQFIKQKKTIEQFNVDTTNIVVGGYSFGGAMALTAAIYHPKIKRIISIAGADESVLGRKWQTNPEFRKALKPVLESSIYPEGPIKGDLDTVMKQWLGHLDYYDQIKHAEKLYNRDILLLGGWDDQSCIAEEITIPLYRRLRELDAEHVKIKMFPTDHSFRNVRQGLTDEIWSWITQASPGFIGYTKNQFIGTWNFLSLKGENSKGDIFYPYGEDLYGRLMYDANGNMSVFLMRPNRPKFSAGDMFQGTLEEIRKAADSQTGRVPIRQGIMRFPMIPCCCVHQSGQKAKSGN